MIRALPHILARVFGRPLLIERTRAEAMVAGPVRLPMLAPWQRA